MAKKSMIARDVKRKKLVERYAAKRKSLIDAFKSAGDRLAWLAQHLAI
jgi:small subunit ribosomal protein S14